MDIRVVGVWFVVLLRGFYYVLCIGVKIFCLSIYGYGIKGVWGILGDFREFEEERRSRLEGGV